MEWAQLRNFAVHFIVCCGETSFKFVFLGGLGSRVVGSAFKMAVHFAVLGGNRTTNTFI